MASDSIKIRYLDSNVIEMSRSFFFYTNELRACDYISHYQHAEPFVHIYPDRRQPNIAQVKSAFWQVKLRLERRTHVSHS